MRKPIIAGNWKMNKTPEEAASMVKELASMVNDSDVEVVICAPFTALHAVKDAAAGTKVKVGAQNMHWEDSGAFTGEVSPIMLNEIGIDYVIIGHSERRQLFCETDETVNKKIKAAINHNIKPILCVGETLKQREKGEEKEIVKNQIKNALKDVKNIDTIVVAYEPIWAIGTGKTASSDEANDMIHFIRKTIEDLYGKVSESIRIQYGGSVKPNNVGELMGKSDIDGALVGGASLKAKDFADLVNFKIGG